MPFNMVTEIQPHDQLLHIKVQARSLDGESTESLTEEVLTAAAQRTGVPVVLDMSRVKFAPSVALGSLAQLSRGFKLDGRRIAVIGVDPRLMGAIRVTRLDTVLEIYDTLDQVIAGSPGGS